MRRALFLILPALCFALTTYAAGSVPSRTLHLGDTGPDVTFLQQRLNDSLDTQVAADGPGSSGNETDRFGAKTLDAVKRFQEKYRADILTPAGLEAPTGVVGTRTLQKLQALANPAVAPKATASSPQATSSTRAIAYPPTNSASANVNTLKQLYITPEDLKGYAITPITPDMQVPPGTNPNMINFDYTVSQIREAGKKQGMSDADIEKSIAALRTTLATTTDLRKEFFKKFPSAAAATKLPSETKKDSLATTIGATIQDLLSTIGLGPIHKAQAVLGVPFGGLIVMSYPCTCTAGIVWQTIIAPPLPPTYATILDAVPGAQLFMSHNIPLVGIETLGFYEPVVGTCWMGVPPWCWPMPEWGVMTPFVGSSLL